MKFKTKSCVECKYYYDYLCSNTLLGNMIIYDPVTGEEYKRYYKPCRFLRKHEKLCGIDGKYWEPKPKKTWLTSWFK